MTANELTKVNASIQTTPAAQCSIQKLNDVGGGVGGLYVNVTMTLMFPKIVWTCKRHKTMLFFDHYMYCSCSKTICDVFL